MSDTIPFVAQNFADPALLSDLAFRILGALVLVAAVAILFTCAGFVLAQCCKGNRRGGIPAALLLLVAVLST